MTSNFSFVKLGVCWALILFIPSLGACNRTIPGSANLHSHPKSSSSNTFNSSIPSPTVQDLIQPLPSTLHKIIKHNDSHALSPKIGTTHLHRLIQKLRHFTQSRSIHSNSNPFSNSHANESWSGSGRIIGINKIASSIPSYITNNIRLKRQLEGIFHVRSDEPSTATSAPISTTNATTTIPTTPLPRNVVRIRKGYRRSGQSTGKNGDNYGNNDQTGTTKKETANSHNPKEVRKIATIANSSYSKKLSKDTIKTRPNFTDTGNSDPSDLNGKRNFTVEIVEISRKTTIKQDGNDNSPLPPPPSPIDTNKQYINSEPYFPTEDYFKPSLSFQDRHPNLKLRKSQNPAPVHAKPNPIKFYKPQSAREDDSSAAGSQTEKQPVEFKPQVKYAPITTKPIQPIKPVAPKLAPKVLKSPTVPIANNPVKVVKAKSSGPIQIKVDYQEQIPYNDGEVDDADLKDYVEGHSTFGAKGNFKHTLSRNVSGFLPNIPIQRAIQNHKISSKVSHGVQKRTPQRAHYPSLPSVQQRRSTSNANEQQKGVNEIAIEQAKVKQRAQNPKITVYTATGVPSPEDEKVDKSVDNNVFQYSGNRENQNQFPKLAKATLDELYRQGHPAVAKPPGPLHQSHPLAGSYAHGPRDEDFHGHPYRPNPLVDDVPLKFDPESDRYYGEPVPENKDKVAQPNRPKPARIENQDKSPATPEIQEQEPKREREPLHQARPSPRNDDTRENYNNNQNNNNHNDNRNNNNGGGNDHQERPFYQRVYEPPRDDEYYPGGSGRRNPSSETDSFIKDFVSLDDNFQSLPRPSADEENFRSLVPAEADDEAVSRYFEPDNDDYRDPASNNDDHGPEHEDEDAREGSNNSGSKERRPPPRRQREEDDYSPSPDDNSDEYGRPSADDFDPTYVDALKQFDDEIKRLEEDERKGITTGHTPTSTGEPPLVITSPGPTVSYQRHSAQGPTHATTPVNHHPEPEEEEEEEERTQRPGLTRNRDEARDEREEEQEESEEEDDSTPATREDDPREDEEKSKDGDETVKVSKVIEIKGKDDKGGNLDEDITNIEQEFGRAG